MSQDITSIIKSIEELKKAVSLISEKIQMIESNVNRMSETSLATKEGSIDISLSGTKKNTIKTVVRRVDDEDGEKPSDENFQQKKYDIKVVGLGVEKIKE